MKRGRGSGCKTPPRGIVYIVRHKNKHDLDDGWLKFRVCCQATKWRDESQWQEKRPGPQLVSLYERRAREFVSSYRGPA